MNGACQQCHRLSLMCDSWKWLIDVRDAKGCKRPVYDGLRRSMEAGMNPATNTYAWALSPLTALARNPAAISSSLD